MSSYLMTPPTIPRKRARQSLTSATFEPLLATPELVMSASNASFESIEPCTPTSQRIFSTPENMLPPPTPRFTRTQTPQTKTVLPPSPSPAARVRSSSYLDEPVTPLRLSHAPGTAPPATPLHQQRTGAPRTPHTPSPVSVACPAVYDFVDGPSSSPVRKEVPFRATLSTNKSIQRASNALQDMLFDADPFMDNGALATPIDFESPNMDMDVDDAFFSTPLKSKAPSLLPTPEPESPCTPPRQIRRSGLSGFPRSPRHWDLAKQAIKA